MPETLIAPERKLDRSSRDVQEQGAGIAYVMSRFPKLTETFVIFEILALKAEGAEVEIYPLLRARNTSSHPEGAGLWVKFRELFRSPDASATMHPEAVPLVARAHFHPLLSGKVIRANLYFMLRHPLAYFCTLWNLVRSNLGSRNYLFGGLAIFPKTVMTAREMQSAGISHVHAHFANHPAAAAYIIHSLTGIPYSFTAHGADLHVDQHMLKEKVHNAQNVITISQYNKDLILEVCGEQYRDKIHVVHCGVDTSIFQVATRRDGDPDRPGIFSLVCVGTMYEVKGQVYLIEACRLLKERNIDVVCHLVGDGPDRDMLKQKVLNAGLSDRVIFHGKLVRDEIAELHQRANALVVPSVPTQCGRREGIPVVLMEGMASGLPVIASNISGIPELVTHEETGLLVPPRDAHALAGAVERLANNAALCRRLGHTAREKVLAEFDLQKNAGKLWKLFQGENS